MIRLAALLIGIAQALLVWVALAPSGPTAIWYTFVGTPLLGLGCLLALVALGRNLRSPPRSD